MALVLWTCLGFQMLATWRSPGASPQKRLHMENNFGDAENTSLMVSVINFRSGLDKDPLLAWASRQRQHFATKTTKQCHGYKRPNANDQYESLFFRLQVVITCKTDPEMHLVEKVFVYLVITIAWYYLVFLCRSLCYLVHYLVTCFTFQFLLTFL